MAIFNNDRGSLQDLEPVPMMSDDDMMGAMSDMEQEMYSRSAIANGTGIAATYEAGVPGMGMEEPMDGIDMGDGLTGPREESPLEKLIRWADPATAPNIAEELDDSTLAGIAMRVIEETTIDETSRKDWLDMAKEGLDMALQKPRQRTGTILPNL